MPLAAVIVSNPSFAKGDRQSAVVMAVAAALSRWCRRDASPGLDGDPAADHVLPDVEDELDDEQLPVREGARRGPPRDRAAHRAAPRRRSPRPRRGTTSTASSSTSSGTVRRGIDGHHVGGSFTDRDGDGERGRGDLHRPRRRASRGRFSGAPARSPARVEHAAVTPTPHLGSLASAPRMAGNASAAASAPLPCRKCARSGASRRAPSWRRAVRGPAPRQNPPAFFRATLAAAPPARPPVVALERGKGVPEALAEQACETHENGVSLTGELCSKPLQAAAAAWGLVG